MPTIDYKPKQGQAMMAAVVFFLAISLSIIIGVTTPVTRQSRIADNFAISKQSYATAESSIEDVTYRFIKGKQVGTTESLTIASSTATTIISDVGSNEKQIDSTGILNTRTRKLRANLTVSSGVSFNYGVQAGDGGFVLQNTATIVGNVYSNGPINGQNSNLIKGDIISAGSSGLIDGVVATGTAYAHTIRNSTVGKDAYYQVISNTSVGGVSYPGSPNLPKIDLPISDSLISQWETDASNGGTISTPCPYQISSNTTLGPVKINCNLIISGSPTVTLGGAIWVNGNIIIKNSPKIKIAPSLGNKSVPIIADNPSNRTTSSKIEIQNSAVFEGSGGTGSYILMISQNNSAKLGGTEKAIEGENSVSGDLLLYAGHGEIEIANSISLKEVTAYRIRAKNSAQVTYTTGLANLLFTSGPSGSWVIKDWAETP